LVLDHEAPGKLVTQEPVGLLAHRDALERERAVVEDRVAMQEAAEVVAPQSERARRAVLEVKHLVAEADGRVTAAGAALVGIDVQVVDGGRWRRPRPRRDQQARDEDEDGAESNRATGPSRPRSHP